MTTTSQDPPISMGIKVPGGVYFEEPAGSRKPDEIWECSEALNKPLCRLDQAISVLGLLLGDFEAEDELCSALGMLQDALTDGRKEILATQDLILKLRRQTMGAQQ